MSNNKAFSLYNGGQVESLANEIAEKAKAQGLTLSRWQANDTRSGYVKRITYALHTGERAAQFRYQPDGSIEDYVILDNLEGTTERCEAYRELSRLMARNF